MPEIKDFIRTIPDFPYAGIMFRDVTTLFADPVGLRMVIDQTAELYQSADITKVVALEARGFIHGGAIAAKLGLGFVLLRKQGKLPGPTIAQDYELEYGSATIEMHDDALEAGDRVLLIDDLIATGGTAEAGIRLVERLGAQITDASFIIDLPDLGGRQKIESMCVRTTVLSRFEGL